MRILMIMTLLLISVSVRAQEALSPPPITAENVLELQSVTQLDFDNIYVPALNPDAQDTLLDAEINVGWFVYSPVVDRFLVMDASNTLHTVFGDGASTYSVTDIDLIDAVPFGDGFYALLLSHEDGFSVWYDNLSLYGGSGLHINVTSDVMPAAIWVTCSDEVQSLGRGCYANVEATQDDTPIIVTMPIFDIVPGGIIEMDVTIADLAQHVYAPSTDENAVVRIGRIPAPYVVTSSLDGVVKLWNMWSDEPLHEVDNSTGEPSVFGNINADATHLVWRDNANETLFLLNFETGENREIAALNGEYAQWYFLSNDASVIIAVNLGGQPNIVVWDTETGERTELGNYRECARPQPDMARLTPDGTTLIIGCDTGLDIWRVNQGE